jgi:hypothetical protein
MTRGLDITDLFEAHHLNMEKASALLPKYYIKVCAFIHRPKMRTARSDRRMKEDAMATSCYAWAPGDFYSTLRSRLKPLIPHHGPTAVFQIICFATLVLWLLFWSMAVSQGSFLFAFASGLMMHALMGIGFVALPLSLLRSALQLESLSALQAQFFPRR